MPAKPWRFSPGDTAFVRPATLDRKVVLIQPTLRTAENGVQFPTWLVLDEAGKQHDILQIELSSRPVSVERGRVTLLKTK